MYRIVTEEKNVEGIKAMLVAFGLDFTLYRGTGSWKGNEESSVAVELDRISQKTAGIVARAIKTMNNQEAVLLQRFQVKTEIV